VDQVAEQNGIILVVDDDASMRELLSDILAENGYLVETASDYTEMKAVLDQHAVRLILLDVMLPGPNGFDICRELRASKNVEVPIIMISARGAEADRVAGLELGADDYISKPFGQSEVIARVRAMLRRLPDAGSAPTSARDVVRFAGFRLDHRRRELFSGSGAAVILSAGEFDLLANLVAHPQQVVTREALLELSRFRVPGSSDRSVDVLISRLRNKLGDDSGQPLIRTVRGFGYMLAADVEPA
jgi:two-component system OmpR family response regulator